MKSKLFWAFYLWIAGVVCGTAQVIVTKGSEIVVEPTGEGSAVAVEITAEVKGDRPRHGMSAGRWGIVWRDTEGNPDSLVMQWGNSDFGADGDRRFLKVKSWNATNEFTGLHPGQETLYVTLSLDSREAAWCVAQDRVLGRGRHMIKGAPDCKSIKVFSAGRDLQVERVSAERTWDFAIDGMTEYVVPENFANGEDVTLSPAGVWHYLDRDNDPAWSRPGGKYTLGIIKDEKDEEAWTIVYLGGAVTNSDRWQPGMRKGKLKASGFMRDFNLEWIDAMYGIMEEEDECSAALSDDGQILTLRFPLDKATLRFSRQL